MSCFVSHRIMLYLSHHIHHDISHQNIIRTSLPNYPDHGSVAMTFRLAYTDSTGTSPDCFRDLSTLNRLLGPRSLSPFRQHELLEQASSANIQSRS
jgi:hypothetical protein